MSRLVQCVKLGRELPGMEYPPFGGDLGTKIWSSVSEEAWGLFTEHFKMIMNEYRLAGGTEQANRIFMETAESFFFGDGATQAPPDFVPPEQK